MKEEHLSSIICGDFFLIPFFCMVDKKMKKRHACGMERINLRVELSLKNSNKFNFLIGKPGFFYRKEIFLVFSSWETDFL